MSRRRRTTGGIALYELDVAPFERREPTLWERLRDDGIVDGAPAFGNVRHQDGFGGMILYGGYFTSTLKMFRRDRELATRL